jgi:hypothetical protein
MHNLNSILFIRADRVHHYSFTNTKRDSHESFERKRNPRSDSSLAMNKVNLTTSI